MQKKNKLIVILKINQLIVQIEFIFLGEMLIKKMLNNWHIKKEDPLE